MTKDRLELDHPFIHTFVKKAHTATKPVCIYLHSKKEKCLFCSHCIVSSEGVKLA